MGLKRTDEFRKDPDLLFCRELPPRFTFNLFNVFVHRSIRPCLRSHLLSLQGLR